MAVDLAGLTVEFTRGKRTGKNTVITAKADDIVHRHTFNLDNATARRKFLVTAVSTFRPDSPQDDWPADLLPRLDAKLIELGDVPAGPGPEEHPPPDETPDDVKAEAVALLNDPKLLERVARDLETVGVTGERKLVLTLFLVGVSRLLTQPLNGIVKGASASGKSYVIDTAASLFPPEAVIRATQMTTQALFHMKPGTLAHKFIVAGERSRIEEDERAEATRALRELMSAGRLSKLMPVKVEGRVETVLINQEGPVAFVESTTLRKVFDEDENRCLQLETDESPDQTRRVIDAAARAAAGGPRPETQRLIQVHHAAQRLLEMRDVIIPFAEKVGSLFPSDRVDARRNFNHLMNLTRAIALLYQRQRPTDDQGRVIATAADYQLAAALAADPMNRAGGGLPRSVLDFHVRLKAKVQDGATFTTADAKKGEKGYARSVYGWLTALNDAGVIEQTEPSRGAVPAKWKLTGADPTSTGTVRVPDVDTVFHQG